MTPTEFLARYPEFRSAGALIEKALADATLQVDPAVYGLKAEMAIGLIAAIDLAGSPFGRSLRLDEDDRMTSYETKLNAIKKQVGIRMIVT